MSRKTKTTETTTAKKTRKPRQFRRARPDASLDLSNFVQTVQYSGEHSQANVETFTPPGSDLGNVVVLADIALYVPAVAVIPAKAPTVKTAPKATKTPVSDDEAAARRRASAAKGLATWRANQARLQASQG